jgi:hypothetical protein
MTPQIFSRSVLSLQLLLAAATLLPLRSAQPLLSEHLGTLERSISQAMLLTKPRERDLAIIPSSHIIIGSFSGLLLYQVPRAD